MLLCAAKELLSQLVLSPKDQCSPQARKIKRERSSALEDAAIEMCVSKMRDG
jgi:hypothetical protein